MMTLPEIRERLRDRNIQKVSEATGLHPHSIYRLMKEDSRPAYETVKKIIDYLEA